MLPLLVFAANVSSNYRIIIHQGENFTRGRRIFLFLYYYCYFVGNFVKREINDWNFNRAAREQDNTIFL